MLKMYRDQSTQKILTPIEMQVLEESLRPDYKHVNVRLRRGEYQYELSKVIASFQLELCFPDIKALVKEMYGEEKVNDIQLVRKFQTILKKLEKSGVVKILPKVKPWELQRYALSSMRFIDSEKNQVSFATDEQIQQMHEKLKIALNQQKANGVQMRIKVCVLVFVITFSYVTTVWSLLQPTINPLLVAAPLSLIALCAVVLGRVLSRH